MTKSQLILALVRSGFVDQRAIDEPEDYDACDTVTRIDELHSMLQSFEPIVILEKVECGPPELAYRTPAEPRAKCPVCDWENGFHSPMCNASRTT